MKYLFICIICACIAELTLPIQSYLVLCFLFGIARINPMILHIALWVVGDCGWFPYHRLLGEGERRRMCDYFSLSLSLLGSLDCWFLQPAINTNYCFYFRQSRVCERCWGNVPDVSPPPWTNTWASSSRPERCLFVLRNLVRDFLSTSLGRSVDLHGSGSRSSVPVFFVVSFPSPVA